MSANLEEVKKVLSDAMKDRHRYWKERLQECTLIEEVYPWLRNACPELGGKGILGGELLLSLFNAAELAKASVFVRIEKTEAFRPESSVKEGYYFVFGGEVLQCSNVLRGCFFEGCEATVESGHGAFFHDTKGKVGGNASGAAYRNATVDLSDRAELLYFNSASGIASLSSHVAAFDCACVDLLGESSGLGQGFAKLSFSERSHGTVLGNAVAYASGESKVRLLEQAICLSDGHSSVVAEDANVIYRLSKQAKISLDKKSLLKEVKESDISRYLNAFEAYNGAIGKPFGVE